MLMIMDNGKTNHLDKLEYGVVARHCHPFRCTMSCLAFYLFFRWNIMREPPPTFKRPQHWCRIHPKGVTGDSPSHTTLGLSGRRGCSYNQAGLLSLKETHSGRGQGARHAELAGVTAEQIENAGRRNTDAMIEVYMSVIPREPVR
jgi:hypothetical protein